VTRFGDAMQAYRAGDWRRATAGFELCLKLNPNDNLSQTYIDRCHYLETHPPVGEWNGVGVMKEK